MANRSIVDLSPASSFGDGDYVVGLASYTTNNNTSIGACKISYNTFKNSISQWNFITNKPFENIDSEYFSVDLLKGNLLTINPIFAESVEHSNRDVLDKFSVQSGILLWNNQSIDTSVGWSEVVNKPFDTTNSSDFSVSVNDENDSGSLKVLNLSDTIKNQLHTHENKTVIDKFSVNSNNKLLWNNSEIASSYTLPVASSSTLGGVKIGSGVSISTDGTISVDSSTYTLPTASSSILGGVMIGDGINIDNGVISVDTYELPTASAETLGGIKIGDGLSIDDGVVSVDTYELPTASSSTLGGVKIGEGLSIDDDGIVNVTSTGLDFQALSDILVGDYSGITISVDTESENKFKFEVDGIPSITINDDNEWCIDGVSTGKQSKGDRGDNGTSVTATTIESGIEIKNIDTSGTETVVGVLTNGQAGYSPVATVSKEENKTIISITDKNGTTAATINDGITPTISISDDGYWIINGTKSNVLANASIVRDSYYTGLENRMTALENTIGTLNTMLENALNGNGGE